MLPPAPVTTRRLPFLVVSRILINLHLPLLQGGGTSQSIIIVQETINLNLPTSSRPPTTTCFSWFLVFAEISTLTIFKWVWIHQLEYIIGIEFDVMYSSYVFLIAIYLQHMDLGSTLPVRFSSVLSRLEISTRSKGPELIDFEMPLHEHLGFYDGCHPHPS